MGSRRARSGSRETRWAQGLGMTRRATRPSRARPGHSNRQISVGPGGRAVARGRGWPGWGVRSGPACAPATTDSRLARAVRRGQVWGGLGLGETVARTLDDYFALALALARRPAALRRLRRRLRARRAAPPAVVGAPGGAAGRGARVFDTEGWVRRYEAGLRLTLETRILFPDRTGPGHGGGRRFHVVVTG